jgi:subtilisin family serine protease
MNRLMRRLLLVAAAMGLAAAPALAAPRLADKSSEASVLVEQAAAGGAAVIVELAAPAIAQLDSDRSGTQDTDAEREKLVATAVDGFVDRFFAGRADRAATKDRPLRKMRYAPLVAFVATAEELERLAADPSVVRVREDKLNELKLTQAVPLVGAPKVWDKGGRGAGTVVAVLDTGVQASHPFFGGRVVLQACFSTGKVVGSGRITSLCPNGEALQIGGNAGRNCDQSIAGCEHGTHVAGIIAGDNPTAGDPPAGVAPKATIAAIQVFSLTPAGSLSTQDSDYIAALEFLYSVRNRIDGDRRLAAINMSFGGNPSWIGPCNQHPAKPIIRLLRQAGVASVIATGNEYTTDTVGEPACVPGAIRVGSTDKSDLVSDFSNVAEYMDVFAPGRDILSSMPTDRYALDSGTSMATPMVVGAFAALRSAVPSASVDEILHALVTTGKPVKDTRFGGTVTKPRIQINRALLALQERNSNLVATTRTPVVLAGGQKKSPTFSVTLSARQGTERWRLLSKPAWLVASRRRGVADKAGQKVQFSAEALPRQGSGRTGWLVFAAGDGSARSQFVRVDQRRTESLLVVDVQEMHPLEVRVKNGVATPSRFTVTVSTTTGSVPFEIYGLPAWLKASETSGIATRAPRTISFRIVPPQDLKAVTNGGAAFLQTDIGYEAMSFHVRLTPAGKDKTTAALAAPAE